MKKIIRRPNVKNGILVPLGNGFALAIGNNPNKTDDIDIENNNKKGISINHGEIIQETKNGIRIFSDEPIINGVSPSKLLYGGLPPNKVFKLQENYKKEHHLNDDGTHYEDGGNIKNERSNKFIKGFLNNIKQFIRPKLNLDNIKTTSNRPYNKVYIDYINRRLENKGFYGNQKASILANIIEESGGDPFAVDETGKYKGLLQWESSRYSFGKEKNPFKEIDNQIDYISNTITNYTDGKSWNNGGKGSGYNSYKDAVKDYNKVNDLNSVMKGFTIGYVRPSGKINSYKNRLKVAEQVSNLKDFDINYKLGGKLNKQPLRERLNDKYKENMKNENNKMKKAKLGAYAGDWLVSGINTLGSLGSFLINNYTINKQKAPQHKAALLNPVKLKTKINIEPQLNILRGLVGQVTDAANRTSASSRTAYQKIANARRYALSQNMSLLGEKENKETELINQDRINQQNTYNKNVENIINTANYNADAATNLSNTKTQLRGENATNLLNGVVRAAITPIINKEQRRAQINNLFISSLPYIKELDSLLNPVNETDKNKLQEIYDKFGDFVNG